MLRPSRWQLVVAAVLFAIAAAVIATTLPVVHPQPVPPAQPALRLVALSGPASLTPAQAARGFVASYNCTGAWANSGCVPTTHEITAMTCKASPSHGPGYFDCAVRLVLRHKNRRPLCGVIVIDTAFDVLENNHLIPCAAMRDRGGLSTSTPAARPRLF